MTNTKGGKYRLGLDLGTNSIGWAAVSLDKKGEPCGVLDMGVRIFPDGRHKQRKASNAVDRRVARGQRRRRDRYLKRRGDLMKALVKFGLMPPDEAERKALHSRIPGESKRDAKDRLERLDPYKLRARALDQPLEPFELGRALFHLNQRRGFKSNRKTDGDEAEGNTLSDRIGELRRSIDESGARTLGEFLAQRHEKRETVRARPELGLYPDRAMYLEEFCAIRKAQEPHQGLKPAQWERLCDIIFFQRPLEPVKPGWCQFEYENKEERAPKALPVFQEFRILQEVNNLKVQVGSELVRPLKELERERALQRLRSGKDIKLRESKDNKPAKPTPDLKLPSNAVFNLAAGGRNSIKGDETTAKLVSSGQPATAKKAAQPGLFGPKWLDFPLEKRNEIVRFLLDTEDPEAVEQRAGNEWGLEEAQAQAIAKVSLAPGYGNLSEKAIGKLLPHLEQGLVYSDAVKAAGYGHHSDFRNEEAHDSLPYYGQVLPRDAVGADCTKDPEKDGEVARYGRFPNPTVHIGLNQLRRVVNRLIEIYGKPENIVVELTRGLKHREDCQKPKPKNPRLRCGRCEECMRRERLKNTERNERFREWLQSAGQELTPDVRRKLRLWEEQKDPSGVLRCPYTGEALSFQMAVSNQTEIDHILPFSRTLDNSRSNMVVCVADANRFKDDRTPHEGFGHSPQGYDYQEILALVANFPQNKRWRFQPDAMDRFEEEDRFLDRQLNETSYLSRTAKNYLAYLFDEKGEGRQRVRAAPGRMTALLRRGWGLEGVLRVSAEGEVITGKQRDDHRHHAIDAFVVACTTQGLLQKFARAAGASHHTEERLAAVAGHTPPWKGYDRTRVKPFLDRLVVSYKPDHGTRGVKGKTTAQLHEEMAYGLVELSETGPSKVVRRKKVADLDRSDLDAVRDPAMGKALLKLWDKVAAEGGSPTETAAKFAQSAANEGVLLHNGCHRIVRRVRVLDQQTVIPVKRGKGHPDAGKPYKGYVPGGNEFADVWRMPDGSWRTVAASKFDANQPGFDPHNLRPHPAAKRLMRLQINDMGALGEGDNRRIVRVRYIDGNKEGPRIVMDDHNEADVPNRIAKDAKTRKDTGGKTGMKEEVFSAQKLRRLGFRKVGVDEIGRVSDPGPRKP